MNPSGCVRRGAAAAFFVTLFACTAAPINAKSRADSVAAAWAAHKYKSAAAFTGRMDLLVADKAAGLVEDAEMLRAVEQFLTDAHDQIFRGDAATQDERWKGTRYAAAELEDILLEKISHVSNEDFDGILVEFIEAIGIVPKAMLIRAGVEKYLAYLCHQQLLTECPLRRDLPRRQRTPEHSPDFFPPSPQAADDLSVNRSPARMGNPLPAGPKKQVQNQRSASRGQARSSSLNEIVSFPSPASLDPVADSPRKSLTIGPFPPQPAAAETAVTPTRNEGQYSLSSSPADPPARGRRRAPPYPTYYPVPPDTNTPPYPLYPPPLAPNTQAHDRPSRQPDPRARQGPQPSGEERTDHEASSVFPEKTENAPHGSNSHRRETGAQSEAQLRYPYPPGAWDFPPPPLNFGPQPFGAPYYDPAYASAYDYFAPFPPLGPAPDAYYSERTNSTQPGPPLTEGRNHPAPYRPRSRPPPGIGPQRSRGQFAPPGTQEKRVKTPQQDFSTYRSRAASPVPPAAGSLQPQSQSPDMNEPQSSPAKPATNTSPAVTPGNVPGLLPSNHVPHVPVETYYARPDNTPEVDQREAERHAGPLPSEYRIERAAAADGGVIPAESLMERPRATPEVSLAEPTRPPVGVLPAARDMTSGFPLPETEWLPTRNQRRRPPSSTTTSTVPIPFDDLHTTRSVRFTRPSEYLPPERRSRGEIWENANSVSSPQGNGRSAQMPESDPGDYSDSNNAPGMSANTARFDSADRHIGPVLTASRTSSENFSAALRSDPTQTATRPPPQYTRPPGYTPPDARPPGPTNPSPPPPPPPPPGPWPYPTPPGGQPYPPPYYPPGVPPDYPPKRPYPPGYPPFPYPSPEYPSPPTIPFPPSTTTTTRRPVRYTRPPTYVPPDKSPRPGPSPQPEPNPPRRPPAQPYPPQPRPPYSPPPFPPFDSEAPSASFEGQPRPRFSQPPQTALEDLPPPTPPRPAGKERPRFPAPFVSGSGPSKETIPEDTIPPEDTVLLETRGNRLARPSGEQRGPRTGELLEARSERYAGSRLEFEVEMVMEERQAQYGQAGREDRRYFENSRSTREDAPPTRAGPRHAVGFQEERLRGGARRPEDSPLALMPSQQSRYGKDEPRPELATPGNAPRSAPRPPPGTSRERDWGGPILGVHMQTKGFPDREYAAYGVLEGRSAGPLSGEEGFSTECLDCSSETFFENDFDSEYASSEELDSFERGIYLPAPQAIPRRRSPRNTPRGPTPPPVPPQFSSPRPPPGPPGDPFPMRPPEKSEFPRSAPEPPDEVSLPERAPQRAQSHPPFEIRRPVGVLPSSSGFETRERSRPPAPPTQPVPLRAERKEMYERSTGGKGVLGDTETEWIDRVDERDDFEDARAVSLPSRASAIRTPPLPLLENQKTRNRDELEGVPVLVRERQARAPAPLPASSAPSPRPQNRYENTPQRLPPDLAWTGKEETREVDGKRTGRQVERVGLINGQRVGPSPAMQRPPQPPLPSFQGGPTPPFEKSATEAPLLRAVENSPELDSPPKIAAREELSGGGYPLDPVRARREIQLDASKSAGSVERGNPASSSIFTKDAEVSVRPVDRTGGKPLLALPPRVRRPGEPGPLEKAKDSLFPLGEIEERDVPPSFPVSRDQGGFVQAAKTVGGHAPFAVSEKGQEFKTVLTPLRLPPAPLAADTAPYTRTKMVTQVRSPEKGDIEFQQMSNIQGSLLASPPRVHTVVVSGGPKRKKNQRW
ncbi:UNVERIFIED_CONTAM: hypothetical protein HHA_258670 [Hammondia hammondi]|eukprot:XP_008883143.1 hypothetical protein HHA_258670 [Hammondia hammondi]